MSALADAITRTRALLRRSAPAAPVDAQPDDDQGAELRRRRDALAQEVTELHWDLGGLAYEMAIRDHFRLDVLVRRAGLLQQRDAELAEIERLLHLEEHGAAGTCPNCGAPHSRGAVYCWQCGATLIRAAAGAGAGAGAGADDGQASVPVSDDASTAVMEALLSPAAARSWQLRGPRE
jgi:hypothetical protein